MVEPNNDTAPICVKREALRLYRLQRERIKIDVALERKMKKALGGLSNEIRVATELLRLIHDTEEVDAAPADEGFWDGLDGVDD